MNESQFVGNSDLVSLCARFNVFVNENVNMNIPYSDKALNGTEW